ncbi:MAG: DUF1573 domain-containing protein [Isosphaeraceae bacterium]
MIVGALWMVLLPAAVRGQSWIDSVLPERSFDFGTVAKGSKVRHSFRVVNRLDQEVRIVNWKTKCGCTEVRVGARELPPGTQTTVEAVIDTTRFDGPKPSGLTLIFDKPSYLEVELNTNCFIRSDVTLYPGSVDFGIVNRGNGTKPTVSLQLSYNGGQPNWGITQMQTRSAQVSAKLQEQGRSASGQVQYLLTATLEPRELQGFFKDEITLHTNDPNSPRIPVSVTASVQSAVTVTPSPLLIGPVKAGQVVTKTLLVRAGQPFKLTGVKPSRDDVSAKAPAADSKALHTVNLTFTAPGQSGPYNAVCEIATDLNGEPPIKLNLFATVVP